MVVNIQCPYIAKWKATSALPYFLSTTLQQVSGEKSPNCYMSCASPHIAKAFWRMKDELRKGRGKILWIRCQVGGSWRTWRLKRDFQPKQTRPREDPTRAYLQYSSSQLQATLLFPQHITSSAHLSKCRPQMQRSWRQSPWFVCLTPRCPSAAHSYPNHCNPKKKIADKNPPQRDEDAKWTRLVLYVSSYDNREQWGRRVRRLTLHPTSRTTYSDPLGTERTWESSERRTRPKGSDIDGVGIVAILDKPTGAELTH
jgi:hypothetical protein